MSSILFSLLAPGLPIQAGSALSTPGSHSIISRPSDRGLSCSRCSGVRFASLEEQRAHFKTDSHRLNLMTRESEEETTSTESSGDEVEETPTNTGKVTVCGFSIYRAILVPNPFHAEASLEESLQQLQRSHALMAKFPYWLIAFLSGGRFAATVMDNTRDGLFSIIHKTFHRYTTRRKQGGSQSSRDNKSGHSAGSIGGMIRRENEKLLEEVCCHE